MIAVVTLIALSFLRECHGDLNDKLKQARVRYEEYLTRPYLATFSLPKSSFRLNTLRLSVPLDSVKGAYETFCFERSYVGANDEQVIEFTYEGILFTTNGTKLVGISTVRSDVTNPGGLRCGMSVRDLKATFDGVNFSSSSSGIVNIVPHEGIQSQYLDLVITEGIVEMMVLRRADT